MSWKWSYGAGDRKCVGWCFWVVRGGGSRLRFCRWCKVFDDYDGGGSSSEFVGRSKKRTP